VNAGLDFGFFKNRISGSVEVYRANTTDSSSPRASPGVSGVVSISQNVGATRNQGVEVGSTTVNVETKNFRWSSDFVYTRNKEEFVSSASGANDDIGNRWFIGQPSGVYYNYRNAGIWQTSESAAAAEYGAKPGEIKIVDTNGDKVINANDFQVSGSNRP
ncbi:hypothetical protein OY671_011652, partial [Metschnikowia pulcherrima]